jgi:hypothetical protein
MGICMRNFSNLIESVVYLASERIESVIMRKDLRGTLLRKDVIDIAGRNEWLKLYFLIYKFTNITVTIIVICAFTGTQMSLEFMHAVCKDF